MGLLLFFSPLFSILGSLFLKNNRNYPGTDYTYWMPFVEAKKFKSVNAYFSVCFQDYNDLKNEK